MLVTAEMLESIGANHVVSFKEPVVLVNGATAVARTLVYETLEDIKYTDWFMSGSFVMIYEPDNFVCDDFVVFLLSFDDWKNTFDRDLEDWSAFQINKGK